MEDTRRVRVNRLTGYRPGEEIDMPRNRAITFSKNGQVTPVGWSEKEDEKTEGNKQEQRGRVEKQPRNRMLDTSRNPEE